MRRLVYGLLLTALLPAGLLAQERKALSLKDAIEFALKNNTSAKNAQIDVLIQQAQNAQVTSAAYPRINGKGEFIDYIDPVQSFVPGEFIGEPGSFVPVQFTPKYSSTAGISGSQILFDGGILVALQARKTIMELASQRGKLTEEEIRYNVRRAYHALVIADKQFAIIKTTLLAQREMANEVYVLRENGFAEKIDVDRTNVQINNLVSDSMRIANLLQVSEQILKFGMGMDIRQPVVLTDTSLQDHILQATELVDQPGDYAHRTEFAMLQSQQKLNEYNLKRYRYAAYPSLSAFGNMGYNYATNSFREVFKGPYVWSSFVGLQLNVPIFNGFQRTNQVREVKLNMEKTRNAIEGLKLTIDFQSESAKANLKNALLQFETQKRNLTLAGNVLNLARTKYKEGVGSNQEVTLAQTVFLSTQQNYFYSLLDIVNAEADLQKALGQL